MSRFGYALACTGCALLLARLVVTGEISSFVAPRLLPFVVVAAVVLVVMAVAAVVRPAGHAAHDGHQHGPRWLLGLVAVPLALGGVVGAAPLGIAGGSAPRLAAGASRVTTVRAPSSVSTPAPTSTPSTPPPVVIDPRTGVRSGGYDDAPMERDDAGSSRARPLGPPAELTPLTGAPADISVYDYIERSSTPEGEATLRGHEVAIVGFASADPDRPDGPWVVARLKMYCCVADAIPYMVTAVDAPRVPLGSWVRVRGVPRPNDARGDSRLQVTGVDVVDAPKDPYLW